SVLGVWWRAMSPKPIRRIGCSRLGRRRWSRTDSRAWIAVPRRHPRAASKTYVKQLTALALLARAAAGRGEELGNGLSTAALLLWEALPTLDAADESRVRRSGSGSPPPRSR